MTRKVFFVLLLSFVYGACNGGDGGAPDEGPDVDGIARDWCAIELLCNPGSYDTSEACAEDCKERYAEKSDTCAQAFLNLKKCVGELADCDEWQGYVDNTGPCEAELEAYLPCG